MADNSDSLQELNKSRNFASQTLVNRARNLICSSASFSARQLGETSQQQSAIMSEVSRNSPAMSTHAQPDILYETGHPL